VTAKIVYTDLDGTMVGPGGNFFRTVDGSLTDEPVRALLELHRAGVALVLVSGRTRPQLVEAARIFGADGFVAELGALVGWDGGRSTEVLTGAMPAEHAGRLPLAVMQAGGLPEALFERWPGRLQWHAPWHTGHEADAMVRGLVDVAEVEAWLAGHGWGWLRLRDNGVLSARREWPGLAAEARPPHVYHLMPDGLSKGAAVGWDLARRGLSPADAVAVGDSASDLTMAAEVGRTWLVANGAAAPHMGPLVAGARAAGVDVRVAAGAVGLGWAEAVRDALGP
jgi:hydroxymethylpyrimidine pyrophosphatase-like HAD family hydrolase